MKHDIHFWTCNMKLSLLGNRTWPFLYTCVYYSILVRRCGGRDIYEKMNRMHGCLRQVEVWARQREIGIGEMKRIFPPCRAGHRVRPSAETALEFNIDGVCPAQPSVEKALSLRGRVTRRCTLFIAEKGSGFQAAITELYLDWRPTVSSVGCWTFPWAPDACMQMILRHELPLYASSVEWEKVRESPLLLGVPGWLWPYAGNTVGHLYIRACPHIERMPWYTTQVSSRHSPRPPSASIQTADHCWQTQIKAPRLLLYSMSFLNTVYLSERRI